MVDVSISRHLKLSGGDICKGSPGDPVSLSTYSSISAALILNVGIIHTCLWEIQRLSNLPILLHRMCTQYVHVKINF